MIVMHICMISREFPPVSGGIGYYVYNLSRELIKKGHKVTIITHGTTSKTEKEIFDGIDVFKVTFFPLYPFHMILHGIFVNSLLNSLSPELSLIHLHSPLTPTIKTSLPIVTTVHTAMKIDSRYHEVVDPYSLAEKVQSMYFSPFTESRLLRLSNVVTAVSPSVANELTEYGFDSRKVTIMWNGVDEKVFCPLGNNEKLEKYILYTGVLRARKGLFDLMKCAILVNKIIPNVKFVICGTGPLLQKLKEQVRSVGLEKKVLFLGRVERKRLINIYQNATIYVVSSIYEGLPTVLLEAMACGLPVVATNIGGNRDLISSNVNGLLVPPRSPEKMAQMIALLWNDEHLRKRLGDNARETIVKKYTWELIANNFINVYEALVQNKPI
jgi:glycosyltransferase involved in cell wall biosynthesis